MQQLRDYPWSKRHVLRGMPEGHSRLFPRRARLCRPSPYRSREPAVLLCTAKDIARTCRVAVRRSTRRLRSQLLIAKFPCRSEVAQKCVSALCRPSSKSNRLALSSGALAIHRDPPFPDYDLQALTSARTFRFLIIMTRLPSVDW